MNITLMCILAPPIVAGRYTCGTSCIAPVTILWLAGLVSMFSAFFGGLTGHPGISWPMLGFGIVLWLASGCWTMVVMNGSESCEALRKKHK